jgi:hypothetical protein
VAIRQNDHRPLRQLWVSCDEAGTDGGSQYYGFGSLWMLDQKRGEFAKLIRELREAHGFVVEGEFKWTKVKHQKLAFYKDMVDVFFRTSWLAFHCIVVRKAWVDLSLSNNSRDEAMLKHLHFFLVNKVARCARKDPTRKYRFRFWVDPLPVRYDKADEAVMLIANNALARLLGERAIEVLVEKDSKEAPSIQLCDLLLGAVVDAWNARAVAGGKVDLARHVAARLTPEIA